MNTPSKLTKRQKKSLAFRERKQRRPISRIRYGLEVEDSGVPPLEVQDIVDLQCGEVEAQSQEGRAAGSWERIDNQERSRGGNVDCTPDRQRSKDRAGVVEENSKKRKREALEEESVDTQKPKRKKSERAAGADTERTKITAGRKSVKHETKHRFILFLGNIKYTTSRKAILEHFAACDPLPIVRLLTPKSQKQISKSKGYAFLEFTHRNALQQALKLHHSELEGRRINVELTAGGGGRGATRITKLQQRNKELHDQRKRKLQKEVSSGEKSDQTLLKSAKSLPRYSATAGVDQAPLEKRTWTINNTEDGIKHRGGQKHAKKINKSGGKILREWGTGVNAIPVT